MSELFGSSVLLLDGGMGSMLIAAGLPAGVAPERWLLEHPERVAEVHRAYVEAGAQLVHTNTFGASPPRLEAAPELVGRCGELCTIAVELARASGARWVAGDIGPTGVMLPPVGEGSEELLREAFVEQATALAVAGADLLSIETMVDLREALEATRAALATGLPVICSLTVLVNRRGAYTMMGDALAPALRTLAREGVTAVGLNCTLDADGMASLVAQAVAAVALPVVVQPNAGQPRPTPQGVVYDADPEQFAATLAQMVALGARGVGGCCGTDPRFIAAMRRRLDGV